MAAIDTVSLAALIQARRVARALLEIRAIAESDESSDTPPVDRAVRTALDELCEAARELSHDEPIAVAAVLLAGCHARLERATDGEAADAEVLAASSGVDLAYAVLEHALGSGDVERASA